MFDIEGLIKDKVNDLWLEFSDYEFCKFSPLSVKELPKEGLVFIGINPSRIKKVEKKLNQKNDLSCEFAPLPPSKEAAYSYFKKFFDVAGKTNLKWGHIDLLYLRETRQEKVKGLLKTEQGRVFIHKQCMITKLIIDKLITNNNSTIFVVTNAFARDLLGEFTLKTQDVGLNYKFVWKEKFGTYFYKNTPFFFSSMLSGQRALDNGSFERLVWHINFVKKRLFTTQ